MGSESSGGGEKPGGGSPDSPEAAPAGEIVVKPIFEIGQFVRAPNFIFEEPDARVESGWRVSYIDEPKSRDEERRYVLTKPFAGKSSVTQSVKESQLKKWNP